RISGAPPEPIDGPVKWLCRVNATVTSLVYTPPTISLAYWGLIGERAEYHVAFEDSGLGCAIDRGRRVGGRRAVARPASLHRHRRRPGPDRIHALASPASCQFHRR